MQVEIKSHFDEMTLSILPPFYDKERFCFPNAPGFHLLVSLKHNNKLNVPLFSISNPCLGISDFDINYTHMS